MKIISFAWTSPAIVARVKIVTRRDWKDKHAARFKKGDIIQAYDKAPYAKGKRLCFIELTEDPVKEHMSLMRDSDYIGEGFAYLNMHSDLIPTSMMLAVDKAGFEQWRAQNKEMWVIRFKYRDDLNNV